MNSDLKFKFAYFSRLHFVPEKKFSYRSLHGWLDSRFKPLGSDDFNSLSMHNRNAY